MIQIIAMIFAAFLSFFGRLIITFFGYLSGWVVGWFFTGPILLFMEKLGVTGLSVAQLGAVLAFLGSFLHTAVVQTSHD